MKQARYKSQSRRRTSASSKCGAEHPVDVYTPFRSVLNACHWHAGPFSTDRSGSGDRGRGVSSTSDEWIVRKNTHEPLVTREDFAAVQERLAQNCKRARNVKTS
ncbi:MAG: recombinase family protein [Lachnospiraceae bacterium]|nr:recombinase family protein [Lachnospiraceae bacterium]